MKVADFFRLPQLNPSDLRRANVEALLGKNVASVIMKGENPVAVLIRFDEMVDMVAGIQARTEAARDQALIEKIEFVPPIINVPSQP